MHLNTPSIELVEKFKSLKSPGDLADLLEVKWTYFQYILYRKDSSSLYQKFTIKKKSTGDRLICTPVLNLKILQRKLNQILQLVYNPKPSVHGFTLNKSVLTNAKKHVKKRYVFNVDLENFFPSINFGRVRGMFMGKPYLLPPEVATALTRLCCFENQLPQGAPTSPVISNMLVAQLDSKLQTLAKECRCIYTRYADDMTFSTTSRKFPDELAIVKYDEIGIFSIKVGNKLSEIINSSGFRINNNKVRLLTPKMRQEVTGLTVNKFPNVTRKFIRQVRAMLHAWRAYGLRKAQIRYLQKYYTKHRNPEFGLPSFENVVNGKINYIRMIRGKNDPIYQKLAIEYNKLSGIKKDSSHGDSGSLRKKIEDALWVIECEEDGRQGTAFMLDGVGLITCSHVLGRKSLAWQYGKEGEKFPINILRQDKDIDLAILTIDSTCEASLNISLKGDMELDEEITIAGFPNYNIGTTPHIDSGKVSAKRPVSGISRSSITAIISKGCSGGPVLDKSHAVVGVMVTGADMDEVASGEGPSIDFGVIPINALEKLE